MSQNDFFEKLESYEFRDVFENPLELCPDYINLKFEHEKLKRKCENAASILVEFEDRNAALRILRQEYYNTSYEEERDRLLKETVSPKFCDTENYRDSNVESSIKRQKGTEYNSLLLKEREAYEKHLDCVLELLEARNEEHLAALEHDDHLLGGKICTKVKLEDARIRALNASEKVSKSKKHLDFIKNKINT